MTRTDVMASSRPQAADAASITNRSSGRARRLTVLLVALVALALALAPAAALAAGTTTGYNQEPPKPTTTSTTPSSGVAPSKESEKPAATTPTSETAPTTTTAPSTEKALPFTGFDLRWEIGLGLLLITGGLSIFLMQRRQRRAGGR
jgi:hypothetical protein